MLVINDMLGRFDASLAALLAFGSVDLVWAAVARNLRDQKEFNDTESHGFYNTNNVVSLSTSFA
jgi:hypothetical protein